jgi:hypothetical protein
MATNWDVAPLQQVYESEVPPVVRQASDAARRSWVAAHPGEGDGRADAGPRFLISARRLCPIEGCGVIRLRRRELPGRSASERLQATAVGRSRPRCRTMLPRFARLRRLHSATLSLDHRLSTQAASLTRSVPSEDRERPPPRSPRRRQRPRAIEPGAPDSMAGRSGSWSPRLTTLVAPGCPVAAIPDADLTSRGPFESGRVCRYNRCGIRMAPYAAVGSLAQFGSPEQAEFPHGRRVHRADADRCAPRPTTVIVIYRPIFE